MAQDWALSADGDWYELSIYIATSIHNHQVVSWDVYPILDLYGFATATTTFDYEDSMASYIGHSDTWKLRKK